MTLSASKTSPLDRAFGCDKENSPLTISVVSPVSAAKTARSASAFATSKHIPGMSPYSSPASVGFGSPVSRADGSRPASPVSGIIPGLSPYQSSSPSRVTSSCEVALTGPGSPLAAWSEAKAPHASSSKMAISSDDDAFSFRGATALQFESPGQSRSRQLATSSSRLLTVNTPQLLQGSWRIDEDMFLGTLRLAAAANSLLDLADAAPKSKGMMGLLTAALSQGLMRDKKSPEQHIPTSGSTTSLSKKSPTSTSSTRHTAAAAADEPTRAQIDADVAPAAQKQPEAGIPLQSIARQPKAKLTSDMLPPTALPKQHQTVAATPVRVSARLFNRKLRDEAASPALLPQLNQRDANTPLRQSARLLMAKLAEAGRSAVSAITPSSAIRSTAAASTQAGKAPAAVCETAKPSTRLTNRAGVQAAGTSIDAPVLSASNAAQQSILPAAAASMRQSVRHAATESAPRLSAVSPASVKDTAGADNIAANLQSGRRKAVINTAGSTKQVRAGVFASRRSTRLAAKSVTTIKQAANAARWR